jgi:hypothetical protein
MRLEVHPELWAISKVKAEPERSVCRNASTVVDDLGNAISSPSTHLKIRRHAAIFVNEVDAGESHDAPNEHPTAIEIVRGK